jgi:hypothetical protein
MIQILRIYRFPITYRMILQICETYIYIYIYIYIFLLILQKLCWMNYDWPIVLYDKCEILSLTDFSIVLLMSYMDAILCTIVDHAFVVQESIMINLAIFQISIISQFIIQYLILTSMIEDMNWYLSFFETNVI